MPTKPQQRGRVVPLRDVTQETPTELTLRQKFEANVARYNELTTALTNGQQQIAVWNEERLKLVGKIEAQQEILKEQEGGENPAE